MLFWIFHKLCTYVNFSNFHRTYKIHVKVLIKNSELEVADKIWREENRTRRIHHKRKWSEGKIWRRNSLENYARNRWPIVYEISLNKQDKTIRNILSVVVFHPSNITLINIRYYYLNIIAKNLFRKVHSWTLKFLINI